MAPLAAYARSLRQAAIRELTRLACRIKHRAARLVTPREPEARG
jgi:hypothetical protein